MSFVNWFKNRKQINNIIASLLSELSITKDFLDETLELNRILLDLFHWRSQFDADVSKEISTRYKESLSEWSSKYHPSNVINEKRNGDDWVYEVQ